MHIEHKEYAITRKILEIKIKIKYNIIELVGQEPYVLANHIIFAKSKNNYFKED